MGNEQFVKKVNRIRLGLKEKDFEDKPSKFWRIRILILEKATPFFYMNCAFESEFSAFIEFEKIIISRFKNNYPKYFEIKVVSGYSKKLKKPISVSSIK